MLRHGNVQKHLAMFTIIETLAIKQFPCIYKLTVRLICVSSYIAIFAIFQLTKQKPSLSNVLWTKHTFTILHSFRKESLVALEINCKNLRTTWVLQMKSSNIYKRHFLYCDPFTLTLRKSFCLLRIVCHPNITLANHNATERTLNLSHRT